MNKYLESKTQRLLNKESNFLVKYNNSADKFNLDQLLHLLGRVSSPDEIMMKRRNVVNRCCLIFLLSYRVKVKRSAG